MGISTHVHVIYGWEICPTPEIMKWADEIDYKLPDGAMFSGIDSDTIYVGANMFETNDLRWAALEGYSSFDEETASAKLSNLQENNDWRVFQDHIDNQPPKFYAFVDYS
jgi:hypothetical protein